MKKSEKAARPSNTRWLLFLNTSIAIVLVCAAVFLQSNSSRYQGQSKMDHAYLEMTKAEKDHSTLQHGILHTEAARATAYRSVLSISNGASITWVLVALAFIMNAVFIFRMNRKHQLVMADLTAA